MATISGGVPILGFISPNDSADQYPVTDALYGIDGLRSVANIPLRNAISAQRRRHGMVVFVQSDNTYYTLDADLVTWSVWSGSGGGSVTPTVIDVYSEPLVISLSGVLDVTIPDFVTMPDGDVVTSGVF